MRHFPKSTSPTAFEDWKVKRGRRARYNNIPQALKQELRNSLSKEQSGLCCYCGISLKNDNVHIEHFKPQNDFPGQALNYKNLHASCMGKEYIPSEVYELDFCGHAKKNWYNPNLLVSPLDPNCESYFLYNFNGSVENNNNLAAKETIEKLNLDSYLLRSQRESAIEGIMSTIDIGESNDIKECIDFLETPDQDGNLNSFSFIIAGLLKTLI
ncbi:retron system putative HNH endonuclease [Bacillus sp. FJAT-27445]|uniref:retron system putative HNH endonuclease n=1 Tax=Bacillus sp. FJAT-27445 TaxID=1679166 RepID=UPI000743462F|nr:retron system putative HNH endonuclease [Bacillus sp. FJAT-27445]